MFCMPPEEKTKGAEEAMHTRPPLSCVFSGLHLSNQRGEHLRRNLLGAIPMTGHLPSKGSQP